MQPYANDAPEESFPPRLEVDCRVGLPIAEQAAECLRVAEVAARQTSSWVQWYRDIFGATGIVSLMFNDAQQLAWFQSTSQHERMLELLTHIRSIDTSKGSAAEPERMITIRLPRSVHHNLVEEAKRNKLSLNMLAVSKLLPPASSRFLPAPKRERPIGRKPGPQPKRAVRGENEV